MKTTLKICLILSGSIAAYKACELISRLVKAGHEVQTVASVGALHFVGAASLEGLSGKPVYSDLWARRESMTHISLRRWADLFVFYPASANRINALAAGLAPDLIGALFLANNFTKPFWIAPAMNSGMLEHPATQASLAKLEQWGCTIIDGENGLLACGDEGCGRLAEPAVVFAQIQAWSASCQNAPEPAKRLLLTGGAMTESIDAVRSLTNSSSGRSASAIAHAFLRAGWTVDYLHHASADRSILEGEIVWGGGVGCHPRLGCESYHAFGDFSAKLQTLLRTQIYDAVIHAAAVSDYHVASVTDQSGQASPVGRGKLESASALTIRLAANPKLLPTIRGQLQTGTGRPATIVAFKLTTGENEAQGAQRCATYLNQNAADLVVWNDLTAMQSSGGHPFVLFGQSQGATSALARGDSNHDLAQTLLAALSPPSTPLMEKEAL